MKKLISVLGAGVILLALMVIPARACTSWGCWFDQESTGVVSNFGNVWNDVVTVADTGDNSISGWFGKVFGATIDTGAGAAGSNVENTVNLNSIGCDCFDDLTLRNTGMVWNDVFTKADTGDNTILGGWVFGADVTTGAAVSQGLVSSVVNTNLIGGGIAE